MHSGKWLREEAVREKRRKSEWANSLAGARPFCLKFSKTWSQHPGRNICNSRISRKPQGKPAFPSISRPHIRCKNFVVAICLRSPGASFVSDSRDGLAADLRLPGPSLVSDARNGSISALSFWRISSPLPRSISRKRNSARVYLLWKWRRICGNH